jgi:dihydroxy-acid dehydratase
MWRTTMQTGKRYKSRTILEGRGRAPARSFLKGRGSSEEDLTKPIVGVEHSWIETMPCNYTNGTWPSVLRRV